MPLFTSFDGDKKVGTPLFHPLEKKFQPWLARRVPRGIETYHLTLMTLLWSVLVIVAGYLATVHSVWLWLSTVAIVLQYLTDLVDGEVGRQRSTGLIKWGYYMDHFLDYVFLCSYLISHMFLVPASLIYWQFFLLAIFGCFMVNSFLAFAVTNKFQISYFGIGPTEIRLVFIVVNTLHIVLGSTHMSGLLPLLFVLSVIGLGITAYRTQRSIWRIDMIEKDS